MSDVVFASHPGFGGCVAACANAAAVLGGRAAAAPDDAHLLAAAGLVVLSSWHPSYDGVLAACAGRVVPRWHSPLLQTELSREGWKLAHLVDLLDRGVVPAVAVDDAEVAVVLGRERVVHLPNVVDPAPYGDVVPTPLEPLAVTLVGEAHGRKSLLVQSAAAAQAGALLGRPVTVHVAGQTVRRPGYARWLALAGVPCVEHGRLERAAYLSLVAGASAGLCATLSESYGYAAVDHALLDVPVVVSRAVPSIPPGPLTVERPDSVEAVAATLVRALAEPGLAAGQRAGALAVAAANEAVARAGLERIRSLAASG